MEYRILVEIGARIEDDEYDFEVIDFTTFKSQGEDKRTAANAVWGKIDEWTAENGYNDRAVYDRKVYATPMG